MNEDGLEVTTRRNPRKKWLAIVGSVFALAGLAYFGYWYVELRHFEHTDDAYVQGNLVQLGQSACDLDFLAEAVLFQGRRDVRRQPRFQFQQRALAQFQHVQVGNDPARLRVQ